MSGLTPEQIQQLLEEDKNKPKTTRGGRTKVDPTETRTINVWFKLQHHICHPDCAHRQPRTDENKEGRPEGTAPSEQACWNPNCVDPREHTDSANMVVALVKDNWICRYCFLDGYLHL